MAISSLRVNEFHSALLHSTITSSRRELVDDVLETLVTAVSQHLGGSTISTTLKYRGVTFVFSYEPSRVFWFATADGGVVTDFINQIREFVQVCAMPLFKSRSTRDPLSIAEWFADCLLAHASGADNGGAVYGLKGWHISPRWLPMAPPVLLPVETAVHDSPLNLIFRSYQANTHLGENVEKAMRISVDPWYTQFRTHGTAVLTIPQYTFLDGFEEAMRSWGPTLHHSGSAMDVTSRPGTYLDGNNDFTDWRSSAFDEDHGSGRVLSALQMPNILDARGAIDRLKKDENGVWWFVKSDVDFRIGGKINEEAIPFLKQSANAKLTWCGVRLGMRFKPGSKMSAIACSPLGYSVEKVTISKPLVRVGQPITLTLDDLAWVRSDPVAPKSLLRHEKHVGKRISRMWFTEVEENYLVQARSK